MLTIFVNGDEPGGIDFLAQAVSGTVWCADGGYRWASMLDIRPDLVVGDLDSLNPQLRHRLSELGVEIQQHPRDKEASDLELALREAADRGYREVRLLAAAGGQ